ncbi:putative RNA-binding protein eif1ad [Mortierella sp. AD011]|nr:putative RNA-binding protein eif1ad [Mortierella sp. AD010]KAF9371816.1 putative RNA-binding protein eif1ad [Mortierella sp. AD011]
MSRRRQVPTDILADIPELEEDQQFARVVGTRGKNIHEVQFKNGEEILVNLPPRFRSLVWVKRGSYVIIQPAEEEDKTKVSGDIVAILFPDHIKQYKQQGIWPFEDQFSSSTNNPSGLAEDDGSDEDESHGDDDLFVNNNRIVIEETDSESESEEESEEEEEK